MLREKPLSPLDCAGRVLPPSQEPAAASLRARTSCALGLVTPWFPTASARQGLDERAQSSCCKSRRLMVLPSHKACQHRNRHQRRNREVSLAGLRCNRRCGATTIGAAHAPSVHQASGEVLLHPRVALCAMEHRRHCDGPFLGPPEHRRRCNGAFIGHAAARRRCNEAFVGPPGTSPVLLSALQWNIVGPPEHCRAAMEHRQASGTSPVLLWSVAKTSEHHQCCNGAPPGSRWCSAAAATQ